MPKSLLRAALKSKVKLLSDGEIQSQSKVVTSRLLEMPAFKESKNVSIYLSMRDEIQTDGLIKAALEQGKTVYIPKVTGKHSNDMIMVPVRSFESIKTLPKNSWGIPEPTIEMCQGITDDTSTQIELVIVPGVGFSVDGYAAGGRLGHGKGYYDSFLNRVDQLRVAMGLHPLLLVGVCLNEQIVDHVPLHSHDRKMDTIISASREYHYQDTLVVPASS